MGFSVQGGSGRGGRGRRRPQADINVTPMVDVMLVLLIIFMVAAPMMTSGINVDLPKTAAKPVNADTKPITVTVKEDGSVYMGDNPVDMNQLVEQLRAVSQNDPEHRIFVKGDQHINYGRVMEIMGRITAGGFTHVALLAQMPSGAEAGQQPAPLPPAAPSHTP
ncbi:Biopolymer transport protein ExbD (ExbD) (PDB:2JWK) [Commensalibacter communis]|uniref:Biopolymer transport protein ExbD (ExbD) n=1 Tax=Commensalibacter communis TaxID=2972786 RepID=A0A9W4TPP8_9PROT|nr:protein TolR [Commensalibacter communis]CAI3924519.1 Biopolymer transport protein ExbD (ExbD) (PDB:2JWK) [Commensalibacter communis]CAI3924575.1 Biopolymer transport protein ExbD (ExbD) (PDB:2JWK) [Commensalibacter communis]CAI3928206.1 Biopolymer transport protein ExbD (ExbD) (PDB:2JWK) [Commensalibacter communis]CAI3928796.1 Biopolymer transport protein ExbD (ExbD) (PDB:2JWK) [Commensalibacter communis]CAI3930118.1 Biopolymer transport protein ExbD (ExbD) (PDB:2JWK) [Commensalibacter comm